MTLSENQSGNAHTAHFEIEAFSVYAQPQLEKSPLAMPGVCFNPYCSQAFVPNRPWQQYCCAQCLRRDEVSLRGFGRKVAPALHAWQIGRYEKENGDLRDLSNAGRRFFSFLSAEWLRHRNQLISEATSNE